MKTKTNLWRRNFVSLFLKFLTKSVSRVGKIYFNFLEVSGQTFVLLICDNVYTECLKNIMFDPILSRLRLRMEFGPRPKDRPGIGKVPGYGPGFATNISARDHRRINRTSAWASDFGSLTPAELEDRYPSGKELLFCQSVFLAYQKFVRVGLMFYDEPPRCQINLEMMEMLALERLRFLRLVEKQNSIHGGKVWSQVMIEWVIYFALWFSFSASNVLLLCRA